MLNISRIKIMFFERQVVKNKTVVFRIVEVLKFRMNRKVCSEYSLCFKVRVHGVAVQRREMRLFQNVSDFKYHYNFKRIN